MKPKHLVPSESQGVDVSSAHTIADPGSDAALDVLLELAGEIYVQEGGYWIKVEASPTRACPGVPHGIRYSLTLHAPDGNRVLGFDNAHPVRAAGGRFTARCVEYDHWHPDGKAVRPYAFQDPALLLRDFFSDVDKALKKRGVIES